MLTQNAPSELTAKKVELTKKQSNVVIMPIEEVKKPKETIVKSSSPSVKQKSLKNATSQLKSYLQRQQELLGASSNAPSQDNSITETKESHATKHKVYKSPTRPPQPKQLSNIVSNQNTASHTKEDGEQVQSEMISAAKPETQILIFRDDLSDRQDSPRLTTKMHPKRIESSSFDSIKNKDQNERNLENVWKEQARHERGKSDNVATQVKEESKIQMVSITPEDKAQKFKRHL